MLLESSESNELVFIYAEAAIITITIKSKNVKYTMLRDFDL